MFNKKIKKVITIEGMMCEHCKFKVEKTLLKLEDVSKVKVSLKDKVAIIYLSSNINDDDIINAIEKLDYKVVSIGVGKQ